MRLLVLSFFPAFSPARSGGAVRLLGLYTAMSRRCQVDMLSSSARVDGPIEIVEHTPSFREFRVPKEKLYDRMWNELSPLAGGADPTGAAFANLAKRDNAFLRTFLDLYPQSDAIVHESPFTADIDIFAGFDVKPRIYASHNVETLLAQDLYAEPASAPLRTLIADLETQLLSSVDLVGYCGEEDLAAFRSLSPNVDARAVALPNGAEWMKPEARPHPTEAMAVFVGSKHRPNVEAADFITRRLAPAMPEVTFELIGECAPAGRPAANVIAHGEVAESDKTAIMARAGLAIIPLTSGSGSSLKVLDFATADLPIVSTAFGMRGFEAEPGRHYAAASLDDFSGAVRGVLAATDEAVMRARAFRALAEKRFSWDVVAQRFYAAVCSRMKTSAGKDDRRVLVLNEGDISRGYGGGLSRMRGLYGAIAARRPVSVLSFAPSAEIERRDVLPGIRTILLPKSPAHRSEGDAFSRRHEVSVNDIVAARHALGEPLMVKVYRVLRKDVARIVVEHPYLASLPVAHGDRFIYASHNVERMLKVRLLAGHPDREALLATVTTCEVQAVENADLVVCCSQEDALAMTQGVRRSAPNVVVPNGVAAPRDQTRHATARTSRQVIFIGSSHPPNVEAARLIALELAPALPSVNFVLVGSVCDALRSAMRDNALPTNLRLAGEVSEEEKSRLMWDADAAINPMLAGGGSNVKMADYLAHGLPVVTTPVGARGYDGPASPAIRIAGMDGFPAAVSSLLRTDERGVLADEARRLFATEFDMSILSNHFRRHVLGEGPEKALRVLAVTYRLTTMPMGGGESHFLKLVEALAQTGEAMIDVVAPEVSHIRDTGRFTTEFTFDPALGSGLAHPAIRWARFPLSAQDPVVLQPKLSVLEENEGVFRSALLASAKTVGQDAQFGALAAAYRECRAGLPLSLTEVRGPHSQALSDFLNSAASDYHLILAHNCVFRTCVETVAAARKARVPSIVIPQVHLDDDYYYWPDGLGAIADASIALVSPRAAVQQLQALGVASARFLPPGIDASEEFCPADLDAFRVKSPSSRPYFLVLGRKTGSKRYDVAIEAVRRLRQRTPVDLVMIGPDEDGRPLAEGDALMLGQQDRSVVRGALIGCAGLISMSESESFGIVILEAWLAGRPVIASRATAAFRELVTDGVNGRLVDDVASLEAALEDLLRDPVKASVMGQRGRELALTHDWKDIGATFANLCLDLANAQAESSR